MGKKLPSAGAADLIWLKPSTYEALKEAAERTLVPDPTQFEIVEVAGKKHFRVRLVPSTVAAGIGGGGGRYIPRIGGEASTTLFLSPGSVSYCKLEEEDPVDEDAKESEEVIPVWPTINGVPINAAEPPGFSVAGKAGASVWLIVDRVRCKTLVATEEEDPLPADRIEIYNRNQKPPRKKGRRNILLCAMDFETGEGGAKAIRNLDQKHASDFQVWFKCFSPDGSHSGSDPLPGSSTVGSSDEVDNSSGDSKDCPWRATAAWANKQTCYNAGEPALAVWKVNVGLTSLRGKCATWKACAMMQGGIPRPYPGQTTAGGGICVTITKNVTTFGAAFYFPSAPDCEDTELIVWAEGEAAEGEEEPHECCTGLPPFKFPDRWPHHCGKTCTTVVTPPP